MARYQWMKWLIGVSSVAAFTGFVGIAKEVDKNKQEQQTVFPAEAETIVSTPQPSSNSTSVLQNDDVWQEWKKEEARTETKSYEHRAESPDRAKYEEVRAKTKWPEDEKDKKYRGDDEEREYDDEDHDEEREYDDEDHDEDHGDDDEDHDKEKRRKKQEEKRATVVRQANRASEPPVKTQKRQAEAVTRSHAS